MDALLNLKVHFTKGEVLTITNATFEDAVKKMFENLTFENIEIIDYSEKAIAVIGDTKPIKDELKALGGRFNFRLTCGAGWIFPKTKITEVESLIKGAI